jgi:uncharacterized protein (UPF0548 family)
MPFKLRFFSHPSAAEVRREVMAKELTYAEVGASLGPGLPEGYHHTRESIELGTGERAFISGSDALRAWAGHAHLNIAITPEGCPLEMGAVVVAEIPIGPLAVLAPCRIVSVIGESNSFGFAYGTLPGHPERGEESFVVQRGEDDVVRFEVSAFSRPNSFFVSLGGPIPGWIQRRATRGYLEGVRRFVVRSSSE